MARRSNKTAHVLNLIAGHEAQKEETEEVVSSMGAEASAPSASADAGQAAPAPVPSAQPTQNIAVIDTTEKDPVADLIQQKLSDALDEESQVQTETVSRPETATPVQPEAPAQPAAASAIPPKASAPAEAAATAPPPPNQTKSAAQSAPDRTESVVFAQAEHTAPPAATPAQAEATHQAVLETDAPPAPPEPEPEPEPAFATVNVMERIVHDKIIYYMRQFEVCTCDRCVADTVALTLNGLIPKYIVTMPAAVDPLLSFYTNRLISDVTVEATKACMIVKENPRH